LKGRSATAKREQLMPRLDPATRRETILAAAIPLFATRGFERTRVSDVAQQLGVTEPVVFQNFGTKAELFAAVLDRVSRDGARQLGELAAAAPDALSLLRHLTSAEHLDWMHTSHVFGMLFLDTRRLPTDALITGAVERGWAAVAEAFTQIVRRGQAEGSIRTDVVAETLAWFVLSVVHAREFRRTHVTHHSAALEADVLRATIAALRVRGGLDAILA